MSAEARADLLVGVACRRYDPDNCGDTSIRQAADIFDPCTSSRAHGVPGRACQDNSVEGASAVMPRGREVRRGRRRPSRRGRGHPRRKQRVFGVAAKRRPDTTDEALEACQLEIAPTAAHGHQANRGARRPLLPEALAGGKGESSASPNPRSPSPAHITGRRPTSGKYQPHPADDGPLAASQDLSWKDFVELNTAQEDFYAPPSVLCIHVAWALEKFTLVRHAARGIHGVVDRNADCRTSVEDVSLVLAILWADAVDVQLLSTPPRLRGCDSS